MSIELRFIKQTLTEEAREMDRAKTTRMQKRGFDSPFWFNRGFIVDGKSLKFKHDARERFVDMKRRDGERKKHHPVHNKIVMGHFNEIIKKLMFGLTEEVKQKLLDQDVI